VVPWWYAELGNPWSEHCEVITDSLSYKNSGQV
jgi:hypothetical protein